MNSMIVDGSYVQQVSVSVTKKSCAELAVCSEMDLTCINKVACSTREQQVQAEPGLAVSPYCQAKRHVSRVSTIWSPQQVIESQVQWSAL